MTDKYPSPEYGVGLESEGNHILTYIANELAIRNELKAHEMEYTLLDSFNYNDYKNKILEIMENDD